jgi:TolB-like protein/Tfp pilus assembly protein PilF
VSNQKLALVSTLEIASVGLGVVVRSYLEKSAARYAVNPRNFFGELKRRNVYKVAIAYAVVAWVLMQAASQIFPFFEIPNWAVRLVVLLLIMGFPVALIFAWAFELTPEGLKRTEVADELPRKSERKRAWIYVVIIAGAVAASLFFFGRYTSSKQGAEMSEKSIAVLPFENWSEDKANAYFTEGVQDEILTRLSKIADLKVTSRTSTQHYKSAPENLAEIAKHLGVAHILEGSVQKSGDAVRVNVQLIKAANDSQVWAETFDRKLTDIFSVESDVAKAIADQLRAHITRQEEQVIAAKPTKNIEAYDAYLRGRYFWNKRTSDGIKHAIEHFQQSIEHDPDFALGHAGLADSYIALTFYNFAAPHETMPKAKESAIKALALDDTLAEAHASLAHILMNYDWNWSAAEKEFKRSIELTPDYATGHQWYAIHYLTATGRFEGAVQEMKKALKLDPASLVMNTFMGATLYYAGRYDEAIDQCRRTIEMDPNFAVAHWHLGLAYEQKQALDAATEEFKKAISLSGGSPLMKAALVRAYAKSHKKHEANEMLNELNELWKRQYVSAYEVATIYVALGNNEQAFQLLEDAYAEHSFHLVYLNVSPQFKPVSSDRRFQDLVQRIGLSQ